MDARIVISTYPDKEKALEEARRCVNSKLAACVNLLEIRSLYIWKEKLEDTDEYLAIFKTTRRTVEDLKRTIKDRHPYEVPEIIEMEPRDIDRTYFEWLNEATNINQPE
jgi:periplasmic divalent cation tolerance protein